MKNRLVGGARVVRTHDRPKHHVSPYVNHTLDNSLLNMPIGMSIGLVVAY